MALSNTPSPKKQRRVTFVWPRVIIGCVFAAAFIVLALNVAQGAEWILPFDRSIQAAIFPLRNPDLTPLLEFITNLSGTKASLVVAFIFAVFLFFLRSKKKALVFILTVGVGEAIVLATKYLVDRGRPYGLNLIDFPNDASFPSGHTFAAIAIVAFIIFILLREFRVSMPLVIKALLVVVAVLWPLVIGFSRLYLGVHWPTDVFGSLILGGLVYFPFATLVWDALIPAQRKAGRHARQ